LSFLSPKLAFLEIFLSNFSNIKLNIIDLKRFKLKHYFLKKAAIIGSGIGGLSLAIRLAIKGYEVTVFEANSYPGGKLSNKTLGKYRFDAGPSLFTLPTLVNELFELAGKSSKQHFKYKKLEEVCRYFWEDGQTLNVPADNQKFDNLVAEKFNEKPGAILEYLQDSNFKYEVLDGLFLQDSLHKLGTWFSKAALKGYLNLGKLGIFGTLHKHNSRFSNSKITQLFDRYATYNGSDPYQTPATMGIIPHLEYNIGAFYPENGMHSITNSLYELGKSLGVNFNFNTRIEKIEVLNKTARSLNSSTSTFGPYDIIATNMDVSNTYKKLLQDQKQPFKTLSQEKSGSGLIFYWGIRKTFTSLDLHNIMFSDNYKEEFRWQFEQKDIYKDPTIYINITSKHSSADAPEGCENWFVLINAPNNSGQDWDEIIKRTRNNVISKINRILKIDLEVLIEEEDILDPRTIELLTSSSQGALYGNSSNNKFAAFLRHPNFSSDIKNLYFVGGSVHPGGGIPLALSSAKIAAGLIP
jgi:phytoene desaturase